MSESALFLRFGAALAIGFLVGMEREYSGSGAPRRLVAGERTIALMGLFGCAAAMAADELRAPLALPLLLLPLWGLVVIGHHARTGAGDPGMTTEVAALVTTLVGALCYWGHLALAAALGVITTVILSLKVELHAFVRHLSRADIHGALKLAVITAIALPVLPDRTYGPPPFDVVSPRNVWLMVVLISGISFCGYALVKAIGTERGTALAGMVGGLVSSTAVTLSFSQRGRAEQARARAFALAIVLAWSVMFVRIAVTVAVVHGTLLRLLWSPLAGAAGAGAVYCAFLHRRAQRGEAGMEVANPFALMPAIKFGLLYGLILIVARAAHVWLGDPGLYLSSLVSGLAEVDAITLSVSRLARGAAVAPAGAAHAIMLAAVANTALKGAIVCASGGAALRRLALPGMLLMLAVSLLLLLL